MIRREVIQSSINEIREIGMDLSVTLNQLKKEIDFISLVIRDPDLDQVSEPIEMVRGLADCAAGLKKIASIADSIKSNSNSFLKTLINSSIPEEMDLAGLTSTEFDSGLSVKLHDEVTYSVPQSSDKYSDVINWLIEGNLGEYVKTSVDPRSLNKILREAVEQGRSLPEGVSVSVRRFAKIK